MRQSQCDRHKVKMMDVFGHLLPFSYARALLRSGHSSLPQRYRQGSVGDAGLAAPTIPPPKNDRPHCHEI